MLEHTLKWYTYSVEFYYLPPLKLDMNRFIKKKKIELSEQKFSSIPKITQNSSCIANLRENKVV